MANTAKINLALIGCGNHSHTHAQAMLKVPMANLVACCDLDGVKAERWARQYHCPAFYDNLATLLQNERIDGIILNTWPKQHQEQIELCLAAGIKNILCEKALTLTGAAATQIGKLIQEKQGFLMEACMYRHHPAIRKLEKLISAGDIGPIDSIRAVFSNFEPEDSATPDTVPDWRFRPECGGGVPYDWMSYCINACNHFSGSTPHRVFASGDISPRYQVINRIYALIEYRNGLVGIIESSKHASFSEMLQITGAQGILELPVAWGIYGEVSITKHHRKPDWGYILTDTYQIAAADAFALQLENFCAVIHGAAQPVVPLTDSIINIHTIEAVVNSLNQKTPITLNL